MADDIYIGGKQIPNPKGIHVQSDTDPVKPPVQAHAWTGDVSNAPLSGSSMSTKNAPVHGLFTKLEFRHQPGHAVPKNHPAIQVSEN
jgi:hypothetical protein